jgi:hypothetical protein
MMLGARQPEASARSEVVCSSGRTSRGEICIESGAYEEPMQTFFAQICFCTEAFAPVPEMNAVVCERLREVASRERAGGSHRSQRPMLLLLLQLLKPFSVSM